ncbi:uncharacterized protein DS421_5g165650 [Arachis hypogaea]|nr:uncharacterized protein DS421_5g165650 [Arachis hypogaea]
MRGINRGMSVLPLFPHPLKHKRGNTSSSTCLSMSGMKPPSSPPTKKLKY